jgi:hypothetical protein
LVAHWKNIYLAKVCRDEKLARSLHQNIYGRITGCFCLRYGFNYKDPNQLLVILIDETSE